MTKFKTSSICFLCRKARPDTQKIMMNGKPQIRCAKCIELGHMLAAGYKAAQQGEIPMIVVNVERGCVTHIMCETPLRVAILDWDTDGVGAAGTILHDGQRLATVHPALMCRPDERYHTAVAMYNRQIADLEKG